MEYSIRYISGVIGGQLIQFREDCPVEHLLLDSRRLIFPESTLFFALKGPRRDGRIFLEELYRRGVRNFVVQEPFSPETVTGTHGTMPLANIIMVKDTLVALQELAAVHRQPFAIPVIGITGSNGKTIVK